MIIFIIVTDYILQLPRQNGKPKIGKTHPLSRTWKIAPVVMLKTIAHLKYCNLPVLLMSLCNSQDGRAFNVILVYLS